MARPKLRLARLREIGWEHWDPIGLKGIVGHSAGGPNDDEYDSYLMTAAAMVRANRDHAAVEHLLGVETNSMGLPVASGARARAEATVRAIREDEALWRE